MLFCNLRTQTCQTASSGYPVTKFYVLISSSPTQFICRISTPLFLVKRKIFRKNLRIKPLRKFLQIAQQLWGSILKHRFNLRSFYTGIGLLYLLSEFLNLYFKYHGVRRKGGRRGDPWCALFCWRACFLTQVTSHTVLILWGKVVVIKLYK